MTTGVGNESLTQNLDDEQRGSVDFFYHKTSLSSKPMLGFFLNFLYVKFDEIEVNNIYLRRHKQKYAKISRKDSGAKGLMRR